MNDHQIESLRFQLEETERQLELRSQDAQDLLEELLRCNDALTESDPEYREGRQIHIERVVRRARTRRRLEY